jgi:hypothetical protein
VGLIVVETIIALVSLGLGLVRPPLGRVLASLARRVYRPQVEESKECSRVQVSTQN